MKTIRSGHIYSMASVSKHLDRVHSVALIECMNVYLDLRNPRGSGFWVKGAHGLLREQKGGQFTSNREQRWTDPVTARRVPSK